MTKVLGDRFGVVDIGSNSVRLVVYASPLRAMLPMFNEKVLCALGQDLAETGRLRPKGVELAIQTIGRFIALSERMNVGQLRVVATAAVREAQDGPDFVAEIKSLFGLDIEVLSGEQEAYSSAAGVVSGIGAADGLVADLGGGSLELIMLDRGQSGASVTLPLGPQRLLRLAGGIELKKVVEDALDALPWLRDVRGRALYAVGGALRAVARIHMSQSNYPLHVIHQYGLDRRVARDFAELLSRQSSASLRRVGGVSRQRADVLPVASFVLARMVRKLRPERVVFSAHGLREGLLYEGLSKNEREADPLTVAYTDMERRESRFPGFGDDLSSWTAKLFKGESASHKRLRRAACHLSDVGWRLHSDFREGQAFRRILRTPFSGIDHPGRAFVALSVFARYRGGVDGSSATSARALLDDDTIRQAQVLGLAMRLGYVLAGGAPGLLVESSLRVEEGRVILSLARFSQPLRGETLERRLNALAKAMGLKPDIEIES